MADSTMAAGFGPPNLSIKFPLYRAVIDTDSNRNPFLAGLVDYRPDIVVAADIAGIDAQLVETGIGGHQGRNGN